MKFEDMNPLQRRLHNAAIVLDAEGDEHGFVGLLREAIATEEAQWVEPVARVKRLTNCSIIDSTGCAVSWEDLPDGSALFTRPGGNSGASWSFRIGGLHAAVHHDIRAAIGLAMLAAVPQPPQADALAADHIEDVLAMVPMTAKELDDLLPTNDSMSRKDSQRWIARAVERHHKIGVKQ